MITALADHQRWTARVVGKKIVIKPAAALDSKQSYHIFYSPRSGDGGPYSNCTMLRTARALNIAEGVKTVVRSHNVEIGNDASTATASTGGGDSPGSTYTFNYSGMSPEEQQKAAQSQADLISQFEREIEFAVPGDPTINADRAITLTGTGTAFDQSYHIDSARHILAMRRGYTTEVVARNRSHDSNVSQTTPTAPPSEQADPAAAAE